MSNESAKPKTRRCLWTLATALVLSASACGVADVQELPLKLKDRIPVPAKLRVSLPGSAGAATTASAAVHAAVDLLNKRLKALDTLNNFLEQGGKRDRDVSLLIAVESPPHVADQAVRYQGSESRLDLELINDHAFYYLQVPDAKGYDPDKGITNRRMLVDGGTIVPKTFGTRPPTSPALGVANPRKGFLRVHFNRRPQDSEPAQEAMQLDYDLERPIGDTEATDDLLHFVLFRRTDVSGANGQVLGFLVRRDADGGTLLQSELQNGKPTWSFLAQYKSNGGLAVWGADGKLRGCFNSGGTLLGDDADPLPCAEFDRKFVAPPKLAATWPGLPAGVPK